MSAARPDDGIVEIEGYALKMLLADIEDGNVYKISIQEREYGVAFKVNEGMWTPTLSTAEVRPPS